MEKNIKLIKMKSITVLFFIIIILSASCQNVDFKKKTQESYKQSIQFFENDLVNHFPDKLSEDLKHRTNVLEEVTLAKHCFGTKSAMSWGHFSKTLYTEIAKQFTDISKNTYLSNDTNLLLIFSYCDV